ncbi:hypothetical protein P7H60_06375 [Vagococcus carniphilus]|uniref:rolling circle replication-associated protein n=1 Tax=Vagococcus carniphilus TaxID=218144 RepID=UPI00288D5259|nr:hypothetical protein [Vagococcus carniphilus]MDT2848782.1 hypothetical protein [Vagococcus carniphilus]
MIEDSKEILSSFYRERTYWCGNSFKLVSVVPRFELQEEKSKQGRGKNQNVSRPAQATLNKRNAKKYFRLLVDGNFEPGDLFITFTYQGKFIPKTPQDAKKELSNFFKRLRRRLKKYGKADQLKYVVVTEYREKTEKQKEIRVHHHLIMNNIIDRDELEELWTKKVKKKTIRIGTANTKRVRNDNEYNLDRLAKYMCGYKKEDNRVREWSSSKKNLKRPKTRQPADKKYRRSKIESIGRSNDCGQEFFEKKYPDYFVTIEHIHENKYSGFHYYLKLEKKERGG